MKKYGKLFILCLISFFALTVPIFAREVTPSELGEKASNLYVNKNKKVSYIYVVGEYAFTSQHTLTTQDLMLAAKSIQIEFNGSNKDAALDAMTIHQISAKRDPFTGKVTEWKKENNLLGTTSFPNKFNIRYIDYNYIKDLFTVTFDLDQGKFADNKTSITVEEGEKISKDLITGANAPTRTGKKFKAWVKVENGQEGAAWNFDTDIVNSNLKLKATWYDEVNTDELLKEAQNKIQKNEFYGATFDKENKIVTFHIYDLNKKNSEIENIGLLADIVNIVKADNVLSITISNGTDNVVFDADDVVDGTGLNTKAWEQFGELLAKLTKKASFNEVTLGDLVAIQDKLTLTITLDKENVHSQNNKEAEDYRIKFSYNAPAAITVSSEDEDFKDFNYTLQNTYQIEGKDGLYNVTGYVTEQEGVKGFGDKTSSFYFAYTIKLGDGIDVNKAKVKVPTDKEGTKYNEATFDSNTKTVTVLMEVEESEVGEETSDGYRDIIVDIDGVSTKIRIDFSQLELKKNSKSTVEDAKSETKLETDYGWKAPEDYSVEYTTDGNTVKVKGFLPIFDDAADKLPFEDEHDTGYYIAFAIKTEDSKSNNSTVNIKDGTETFSWTGENFDDNNTIYMLKHLHPDAETKTFTIEVDMDGEGPKYEPYTITVDWSELKLQATSKGNFGNYEVATENSISSDKKAVEELQKYKYNFETSKEVTVKTETQGETQQESKKGLTGKIKEQTLENSFNNNNGYFVPIMIEFPGKGDESLNKYSHSWTLILNTENGETKTYKPTKEEYEQGWVLVLFKIEKDGKQYGESQKQKVIKYQIDFDGDGIDFVPAEYTIDYSDLKFETENKITYSYKDKDGKDKTETAVVYENEIVDLKDLKDNETDYRTFDGWYKGSENVSESKYGFKTGTDEDVTLTAHWNLNVDAFVKDVIENSADYSEVIHLSQAENEITMTIAKPNVKLEELAKTSIPGTIAYILEKNEITGITLNVGKQSVEYNSTYSVDNEKEYTDNSGRNLLDDNGKHLKEEIVKGAKGAFDKELENHEADATLDQLEYDNKEFTIKISSVDNTVTLVDIVDGEKTPITKDEDKTYTFKFDSDFAVVKQNPDSKLGAQDLAEAASSSKKYSTVYVDGNYTANAEIDITANHDVTIMPMTKPEKEPTTTLQVSEGEDVNYAVDIQKGEGTVTIKDLKITGGKRSELRIEDGATVIVDNIDVSGKINQETATTEEMNSSIIVKGNLTATNVKNDDESYNCPTISVVTAYTKNTDPTKPEEGYPDHDVEGNAKVIANGMTKNNKYCLVDRKTNQGIHTTTERYDGAFYYNNPNNSKIYYVGIMDEKNTVHPFDYIQVYYYGEEINLESLGYKIGEATAQSGSDVFLYFEIGTKGSGNKIENTSTPAQNKLNEHTTTILHAIYGTKPVVALNFEKVSGLSTNGNKVSGTLSTQNEDGKFMIPVTLTSDSFQSGVSTVEVTDPNGNKQTYKYDENNENGIATVSNANTIKLELEAIKSSKITGNKGKVYEITVDVDGKEKNEVKPETYTIDYSDVETLEEKINQAAKATLEANSFTVTKNNKINGYTEKFTYEYNKNQGLTYLKSDNGDNVEEYTFSVKYAGVAEESSQLSVVARKKIENEEDSGVYLNDWVYVHPQKVGRAIQEVTMLTDVMGETVINAIDKVKLTDEKAHAYEVTLNRDKYNNWVKENYLSNPSYSSAEWALNETVTVYVELDDSEQYIKSIKTSQKSSANTFDVTFTDVNNTNIQEPTEFLSTKGKQLTEEDIKNFYESGREWWDKHIHENAYKQ